ncbi:FABP family protein [Haematomicrobium sanguinis]|uniref:FABP family protein n=1 Tax=Haematomicrobium sanguinis TaxID=479106 RepID=UPI00068DAB1D|nr:FABP family protein [Haematomicrobium sanguinis]
MDIPTDLTPELVPLSWLLGKWEGRGRLGAGEADSEHFLQRVSFSQNGLPFVNYQSESFLTDDEGNILRPLSTEMGYWALDRATTEADGGPGLIPGDVVPALRNADDVEKLRNDNGGFDIAVTILHPGNIAELYYGTIKGPQIEMSTDMVMRGANSKPYAGATRIFGLVNGDLYWRWDVTQEGSELEPHASAILHRVDGEVTEDAAENAE